jgi:hypothetical protein
MANTDGAHEQTENIGEDFIVAPGKFESCRNLTLPLDIFSVRDRTHHTCMVCQIAQGMNRAGDELDSFERLWRFSLELL